MSVWKTTLRVWPGNCFIRRLVWISYLNRNQELLFKTMEECPQRQFRIIRAGTIITDPACKGPGVGQYGGQHRTRCRRLGGPRCSSSLSWWPPLPRERQQTLMVSVWHHLCQHPSAKAQGTWLPPRFQGMGLSRRVTGLGPQPRRDASLWQRTTIGKPLWD